MKFLDVSTKKHLSYEELQLEEIKEYALDLERKIILDDQNQFKYILVEINK